MREVFSYVCCTKGFRVYKLQTGRGVARVWWAPWQDGRVNILWGEGELSPKYSRSRRRRAEFVRERQCWSPHRGVQEKQRALSVPLRFLTMSSTSY